MLWDITIDKYNIIIYVMNIHAIMQCDWFFMSLSLHNLWIMGYSYWKVVECCYCDACNMNVTRLLFYSKFTDLYTIVYNNVI